MSGLQETFYTMGIIFMGLTFLLMIALLVVGLVIRAKINKIHDNIERKINSFTSLAERGGELSAMAVKQARKVMKKAQK